ncbi:hypothetical protein RF11_02640 [Thelohanellus kitauei]|uniref:Uncharacterized protein n=1 Tax=Thelohanellus kitauei TaxID=669202 RepID=A0A0C2M163_THEKT|nr:hypothetical protein RF11_02640 [Thelohanellus kitauei]
MSNEDKHSKNQNEKNQSRDTNYTYSVKDRENSVSAYGQYPVREVRRTSLLLGIGDKDEWNVGRLRADQKAKLIRILMNFEKNLNKGQTREPHQWHEGRRPQSRSEFTLYALTSSIPQGGTSICQEPSN